MRTNYSSLTPKLRFPGFTNEWKWVGGDVLFEPISNKNHSSDLPILALTQDQGAVPRNQINYNVIVSDKSVAGYKVVDIDDFIISLRSFQGGIEYSRYKGLCSPAYIVLRKKDKKLVSDFYRIYFKSFNYIQELNKKLEGIRDGKMVSYKQFSEILLPLPSYEEQQKISECLSAVDESIAAQQEKVDALKAHKKGLMQQLFPQDGETTPRLRFPGFEGEWIVLKIAQLCSVNRGVRVTRRDLIDKGKYPVFQNTNVPLGYYNLYNVEANNPYVIIGGSAGSMGFCKTEFWAADDCAYFSDNNELDKYFLYLSLLLHAPEIKDNIRGGNIPRLDRKSIEDIRISLPNLPEQRKIASCLSLFDDTITVEKQKIEALKDHKKGLMQQLFPQPVK